MRVRRMVRVGFLAVMAVTGIVSTSESFADGRRVDVIGSPREAAAQADSVKAGTERTRVDVIGNLGSERARYPYVNPTSH